MRESSFINVVRVALPVVAGFAMLAGCGKSAEDSGPSATPPKPAEAATQIQQAFSSASPEVKSYANTVTEALRNANYEQAIQTIQTIKAKPNLTLEQGTAIYNSERALEYKLIAGIGAGDPAAKRAYELLKKSHKN